MAKKGQDWHLVPLNSAPRFIQVSWATLSFCSLSPTPDLSIINYSTNSSFMVFTHIRNDSSLSSHSTTQSVSFCPDSEGPSSSVMEHSLHANLCLLRAVWS